MANIYAYNKSMGNSEFSVSDASTLFFPDLSVQNIVRVIGGKIV